MIVRCLSATLLAAIPLAAISALEVQSRHTEKPLRVF